MNDLIEIRDIDGEPRIDSRIISEKLGVEHKHTVEMLRRYQSRLEKYGVLPFETAKPQKGSNGGRPETIVYLNEHQSTFLVTLSRNSEKAVDLKQKLTESYLHYKSQHLKASLPKTFAESLRLLADQVEKNQLLENKITEDKPLVEFAKNIESSPESIEVGDLANVLCKKGLEIGRNRLFKAMKDKNGLKMLINAQKPYQYTLDNGWLEVEEFPFMDGKNKERIAKKVMVTGKGQLYIEKKLRMIFKDER